MAFQGICKNFLANGSRLLFRLFRKASSQPGCPITFNDESAHLRRIAVVMSVEIAEFCLDESLGQRLETLCRAVPNELVVVV